MIYHQLPRLNIGAGLKAERNGAINADLYPGKNIDMVFDATKPWPIQPNSIGIVTATHVLEHLHDFKGFFEQAWRALHPQGKLLIAVPHAQCDAQVGDPSHVQPWNAIRFCFLQPGYDETSHNPQHEGWQYPFHVEQILERVNAGLWWLCSKPVWKLLGHHVTPYLWNGFTELKVQLRPLKTESDLHYYKHQSGLVGNMVPVCRFIYEHELKRRESNGVGKMVYLESMALGFTDKPYYSKDAN